MDKQKAKIKICKLCGISAEKHLSKFGIFGIYLGCHFPSQKNDPQNKHLTKGKTN